MQCNRFFVTIIFRNERNKKYSQSKTFSVLELRFPWLNSTTCSNWQSSQILEFKISKSNRQFKKKFHDYSGSLAEGIMKAILAELNQYGASLYPCWSPYFSSDTCFQNVN